MWLTYLLFYLGCFFISFFLCVPIGPVNLEVFQSAVKKQYGPALSLALGAAVGDAIWATAAFFGITPFLKNGYNFSIEGIFLLVTAIVTFILGMISLKDARFLENRKEGRGHRRQDQAQALGVSSRAWAWC